GERTRVLVPGEEIAGFGDGARVVVDEGRGLHCCEGRPRWIVSDEASQFSVPVQRPRSIVAAAPPSLRCRIRDVLSETQYLRRSSQSRFSTFRTGVSGVTSLRCRASVSAPFCSQSPAVARRA